MSEAILAHVKRVRELAPHVSGNEQATKSSLIGPLFTLLGYDLTDPRECIPEYRADFGKERSVKPVDWAFLINGRPAFFVEAKDAGKKLSGYDEQLGDYFAKSPEAKLGILTNGIQWRFFTDVVNSNVMDREPFAQWDVLADDQPPFDFLVLLQKSQFNAELIRTFAQRRMHQNLLVRELERLLEPSPEFTKLAVANIETRNLTSSVVENWRPIVASALDEWAKERMLAFVLENAKAELNRQQAKDGPKIETTEEELQAFDRIQALLGETRKVVYEDTATYFKVHLVGQRMRAVCRLYFGKRRSSIMIPLPLEEASVLCPTIPITTPGAGWVSTPISSLADLDPVQPLLVAVWDRLSKRGGDVVETDPEVPAH
jgi:predicted type IV restriction endonuclease